MTRAEGFLDDLDAGLAGTTWLAGDFFSVADITAFVVVGSLVWLALLGGSLGLHRFYLRGLGDWIGWLHPIASALGWFS